MIGCDSIFTTRASPEQVLRAPADFTESHLETWNRTLDPKTYELRESGQTWAVAQVCQGSARTDDQILIHRRRESGGDSSLCLIRQALDQATKSAATLVKSINRA
jgi:hypothetical protein